MSQLEVRAILQQSSMSENVFRSSGSNNFLLTVRILDKFLYYSRKTLSNANACELVPCTTPP